MRISFDQPANNAAYRPAPNKFNAIPLGLTKTAAYGVKLGQFPLGGIGTRVVSRVQSIRSITNRIPRPIAMLPEKEEDILRFPASSRPRLLLILDAEEEFDWSAPFSRNNRDVKAMSAQLPAQRIFERYGVRPTYAVDYAVAASKEGYEPLLDFYRSGACDIGAQLHAWITPPFEEELSIENSFANNLPPELQRRKIETLTRAIEDCFDCSPKLYRAGRYGAGDATVRILEEFGYEIDCSVLPGRSSVILAPDYTGAPSAPYWLAPSRSVLEIPVTIGNVGIARRFGNNIHDIMVSPIGRRIRGPAIAARLRIIDRIRLTPEGSTLHEAKRLTRAMLAEGTRIFVVSYHTPSLLPGHTPYVRTQQDLDGFLAWLDAYCEFFMAEALGIPSTPADVRAWALEIPKTADSRMKSA